VQAAGSHARARSASRVGTRGCAPGDAGTPIATHTGRARRHMTDLLFVIITIGFFALAQAYATGLTRV
jgi:hypothetical protein